MNPPVLKRTIDMPFDAARPKVEAALKEEGFGVITEIDMRATLKKKLDADFRPYVILGACNPKLAHQALLENLDIGVLLPCNVLLYAEDDGRTTVSATDPAALFDTDGGGAFEALGNDVRARLVRMLDRLEG